MFEVGIAYLITGVYLTFCGFWRDKKDGYTHEWVEPQTFYAVIPMMVLAWPYVVWAMANNKDVFWDDL